MEEGRVDAKPVGDDEGAARLESGGGFFKDGVEVGEVGETFKRERGIERS